MAFALTKYEARAVEIGSPSYKKGIQELVFDITGTAADVSLDLGASGGTFWTAAQANATYGALATKALASLQRVAGMAVCVDWKSAQFKDRVQVASLTTTAQYTYTNDTYGPDFAVNAGDGETSYKIILVWEMNNAVAPEIALYGQS